MMVFLWFAVFSIPTGLLMNRIGRKKTVVLSMSITFVAMLVALVAGNFEFLLVAFALLGIGNAILQVSLNPLLADVVRGDRLTSSLTWGQFIKAIASFLGPIIAGFAAASLGSWKMLFPIFATITQIKQLGWAGWGTSLYFIARTSGAFIGAILLVKFSARMFFIISIVTAIAGVVVMLTLSSLWAILVLVFVVGFAVANVFSIIFSAALQKKPERANEISGLMIMGVAGGAVIPPLMGVVSDAMGQTGGMAVLLIAMVYLLFTAYKLKQA
jgi:fucose permease